MVLSGKSVSGGIAIGPIVTYHRVDKLISRKNIVDTEAEIRRFEEALIITKGQLDEIYERAVEMCGEEIASIFKIHQLFLEDERVTKPVKEMIDRLRVNAEYAVAAVGDQITEKFLGMNDNYMKERAADLRDVGRRVEAVLTGIYDNTDGIDGPVIVLADELSPSETVLFDKSKVISFVISRAGQESHTAMLAKTMEIPALVGVKLPEIADGKIAIVDGDEGIIIIEPDQQTVEEYRKKMYC